MQNDIKELDKVEIGDMFFIQGLARVVRVIKKGQETLASGLTLTVVIQATVPHLPIEGLVSENQAAVNTIALNGSFSHTVDEDYDDREWQETWAVIRRPELINHEGHAARLRDANNPAEWISNVICIKETRGNDRIKRCSNLVNTLVEGVKIPWMPIFRDDDKKAYDTAKDEPEKEEVKTGIVEQMAEKMVDKINHITGATTEAPLDYSKMPYAQLKYHAKINNIDISDVSGKGSNTKIRERLNGVRV